MEEATIAFEGTGVNITKDGRRYLGAALGTRQFTEGYVSAKVSEWVREIEQLSTFATTQPHAAYAALTHGVRGKWTFISRTIPDIAELPKPLEDIIRLKFIPALTGQNVLNDDERDLLALPARLGGIGIINPSSISVTTLHNTSSQSISAPLVSLVHQQSSTTPAGTRDLQRSAKTLASKARRQYETDIATNLSERVPRNLQRSMLSSSEKGASSWLSALPITEHGFALHKGAFRDALCLRYGWHTPLLPSNCVCGKHFSVEHALSCSCGGFPSIRHNELPDITAQFLTETCHNVGIEPSLQPLRGEQLRLKTANTEDGARLDIVVEDFWGRARQKAFFDVRDFNPYAQSHRNSSLAQCYKKKRTREEKGVRREGERS